MNNTFYYENNLCGLKRTDFQKNIGGKETDLFILTNDNGAEMAITNYGGAILAIMVPDKNGKLANVVQGHDNIESVINSPEVFLSTLIGRYGNRIRSPKEDSSLTVKNTNLQSTMVRIHFTEDQLATMHAFGMPSKQANKV